MLSRADFIDGVEHLSSPDSAVWRHWDVSHLEPTLASSLPFARWNSLLLSHRLQGLLAPCWTWLSRDPDRRLVSMIMTANCLLSVSSGRQGDPPPPPPFE